ncbi:MAG: anaerobic glycerol-3-phosphate dehydrogenase subunit A [Chloroflexi bacterium]|nr:anaerobic glycerol-3-phosphate dehydrogenase subunit A [Chloroflexota bacterium]
MLETDVLVIGGGATGAGVAWDVALRGLRCVLAEMDDLTTGTSGRYHGLLHSGARYVVRDPESAKECIDENLLLRKLAPQVIEDTGGLFIGLPGDDESFEEKWTQGCAAAGISYRKITPAAARQREPALNPALIKAYEVPDATCDSFDLGHVLQKGAEAAGARFLTYHRVEDFIIEGQRVVGARLLHLRTGERVQVNCALAVIAAGPWSEALGRKAGMAFKMKLSRGANLAMNVRWVNTVVNRLRVPGDGDIFVPVGTVSVIGTTSVKTEDPGDTRVEAWEVRRILENMEPVTPGISRARILRAWAGVRPLYDPGGGDQREAARTFQVIDGAADGVEGVVAIIGGKLTTFRLMAEKTVDLVCKKLGIDKPCVTASTPLPPLHQAGVTHFHLLRGRLDQLEHGATPGALLCECEYVTSAQIEEALSVGDVVTLNDLRRDLRLGMGPCQGGFCAFRAAALRHELQRDTPQHSQKLLAEFVERRFGGVQPLLWGHNLRQALLAEHIYGRMLGLTPQKGIETPLPERTRTGEHPALRSPKPNGAQKKLVVVGAGLAGLTAGLAALEAGARVEIVASGQGALILYPGWLEIGDVPALAKRAGHPYEHTSAALAEGLGILSRAVDLAPGPFQAVTGLGTLRPVDIEAGGTLHQISKGQPLLIVGVQGWRDFFATLIADQLNAEGYQARAFNLILPHLGGNFDTWPLDFANWIDTPDGLDTVARQVKARLEGAACVGFPAILGFLPETRARLGAALGVPLFEIPTLPPSVPGTRLFRALKTALMERGGRITIGPRALGLALENGRVRGVHIETAAHGRPRTIYGDAVLLATGGLYGGGLESDYSGRIWETVHGLPVKTVVGEWFGAGLLSGQAQPIHEAGVVTDAHLRPLNGDGQPAAANLFAAGRLLAGYSPVIESSSEGVDIASATFAVRQALELASTVLA